MDPDTLAKAFVEHYYSTFDNNRPGLANLYQDASMLTFEGQKIQGASNIVAKLTCLPFQQCHHTISTVDCQPSGVNGGMLVFVSGNLQLAGEQHTLKFSQVLPPHTPSLSLLGFSSHSDPSFSVSICFPFIQFSLEFIACCF